MTEIIITAVVTLVSAMIPSGIIFYSQNKRIKNAEAKEKEIGNMSLIIDQWQERVAELKGEKEDIKQEKQELGEKYNSLIAAYKEQLNKQEELMKRNTKLELTNQELCWWKCVMRGCSNRKPPRTIDELEEREAENADD